MWLQFFGSSRPQSFAAIPLRSPTRDRNKGYAQRERDTILTALFGLSQSGAAESGWIIQCKQLWGTVAAFRPRRRWYFAIRNPRSAFPSVCP
jgi:hypothetical protein